MRFCVFCLVFLETGFVAAQEDVKALAAKYRAERAQVVKDGVAQRFPPALLDKADAFAKQGTAALAAGRLAHAGEAFRQARWQLPYQSPHVPDHVARILGNMRLRHANVISAVAFSPDGTRLASGGWDGAVIIWDMGNGHEIQAYTGHAEKVRCVAFSPDGKYVASAGEKKEIKIWDAATGKDQITLQGEVDNTNSVIFSRDGKYLIAGQEGSQGQKSGMVAIYEVATGKLKRAVTEFAHAVASVASNVDGSVLGAGFATGQVQLWQYPVLVDNVNQPAYWSIPDPEGATSCVSFSPDNRTLVRIGSDGVKLYNLFLPGTSIQVGSPRRTIPGPGKFTCAVFSKDSKTLFTGGGDGMIKLWDTETGLLTRGFKAHNGEIKTLSINPAGNLLASAGSDFTARLWDFDIVRQSRDLTGHEGAVWSAAFSPDGQRVVSAGADRALRIWDTATRQMLHTLRGHTAAVTAVLFSPDGKMVLSGAGDKRVKLWDADTGHLLRTLEGHAKSVTALAISGDGSMIISGSADKTVKSWDAATGKLLLTIAEPKSIVAAVALSPDGKQIAVGSVDQTIRLFDAKTGTQQRSWPAHDIAVTGLAYSPDGQWLASCGADKIVRVWPLAHPDQKPITLTGHTGPLSAIAFRAGSQHILSTGSDGTVRLWQLESGGGKEVQTYRGHRDWVTSVVFSKDGSFALSSGVDGLVKIWEITSKEVPLLAEHTGSIGAVAFSPDGKVIATGASDKAIKIWERQTGRELFTFTGHTDEIVGLAFTPDGKTLISSSYDRNIRLWDVVSGKARPLVPGQQQAFTGFKKRVNLVGTADNGKKLLAWVEGDEHYATISAFDLATGTELFSFNDRGRNIKAVTFSSDGRWAGTGARDGSVRIFDLDKKGTLLPGGDWFLYEKGVGLGDLAFTADGATLVAGSDAGDVKICLVAKKETLKTIKAHNSGVIACQVSPDGKRFATVGMNNDVKLWDLASGAELRVWNMGAIGRNPENYVPEHYIPIAFSPDNKYLVTGNANTTAFVLNLP